MTVTPTPICRILAWPERLPLCVSLPEIRQCVAHSVGHVLGQSDHGGRVCWRLVRRPLDLLKRVADPERQITETSHRLSVIR